MPTLRPPSSNLRDIRTFQCRIESFLHFSSFFAKKHVDPRYTKTAMYHTTILNSRYHRFSFTSRFICISQFITYPYPRIAWLSFTDYTSIPSGCGALLPATFGTTTAAPEGCMP